jgi:hypothetical protein
MADKTWVGGTSDDAAVDANWSPSGVPASNDKVAIPDASTTSNDCRLTAATSWGTLTIATDGILVGNGQTLTLNGGVNDGGTAADYNYTDQGQTTNVSGNLDITMRNIRSSGDRAIVTAAANNIRNLKIDDFTADGGGTGKVYHFQTHLTISGDLTVEYGEFNTAFSSTSYNLTVAGTVTLGDGDLLLNASEVTIGGFSVTGDGEMTGTTHANGLIVLGNWRSAGSRFNNADGKVVFKGSSGGTIAMNGAGSTGEGFYDVEINIAGQTYSINEWDLTGIERNLTITAGTFSTGSDYALTVTGQVSVTGTLTCNESAINIGSLYITSNGVVNATNQTTTINKETTVSAAGFAVYNEGTFHHNNGLVVIGTDTNTIVYGMEGDDTSGANSNAFYRVQVELDNAAYFCKFRPQAGTVAVKIANDLTVAEGIVSQETATHSFEVDVDVSIEAGGVLGRTDITGANTFGSLTIASSGEYIGTSGTTTITTEAAGYVFDNGGTFTHNNGTVKITCPTQTSARGLSGTNGFYNLTYAGTGTNEDLVLGANTDFYGQFIIDSANSAVQAQGHTFNYYGPVIIKQGKWEIGSTTQNCYSGVRNIGGSVDIT